jgi:hypothetical protein
MGKVRFVISVSLDGYVAWPNADPEATGTHRPAFMSLGTIKSHLTHVYDKLSVRSRVELAQEFAKRNGRHG